MLKKLLVSALTIAATIGIVSSANAADVYQTIDIESNGYPNINFYPRTLHVCQGDTLHLTIKNTRQGYTRIFMPAFNLNQDIPPGDVAQLDMCIANPIDKEMWFQISSIDAENLSGIIITHNYQVPIVQTTCKPIDISVLDPIINYSKEYCYAEKGEPVSKQTTPSGPVRGFW
ncbi:MAG: hypothetical protein A2287_02865 [Candidatus Melainabacteria bacterium RIFOXYA12_FULL_32_12]|nr:MAG: hypothetical protein A2255_08310 [Candidatus Melainabacteria bacterium RIFOXYA2_FULL_32_9]OGI29325.1 MAG: hypothetical protein A2287_02865 [Candidatus Melainabacteria bacterium RIFOXYA12_FULL_32_12]